MAGNGIPGGADKAEQPSGPSGKPKVRNFECPSCGASVVLRNPWQSISVVCDSCKSVIDASNENYRIISKFYYRIGDYSPYIDLGSRGVLKGKPWEVIGYLVRKDVSSDVSWDEYLLFNPYYGYRWLIEFQGHWSFATPTKERLDKGWGTNATFQGQRYQLYNSGKAEIVYVLGEFYWRIIAGQQVMMNDYINPPRMLSLEGSDRELTLTVSEHIEAREIKEAFKVNRELPTIYGVGALEPSKWKKDWGTIMPVWFLFCIVLTALQMWQISTAQNRNAWSGSYNYTPNTKSGSSTTTPVFKLAKNMANVRIDVRTDVDNSWLYVGGELVNDKTGETFSFDRDVEYYHGTDSDGAWTEGKPNNEVTIPAVPEGDYYINFDIESGDFTGDNAQRPHALGLEVYRDVPTYWNYFSCLLFISIIPPFVWFRNRQTEVSRWANSDFSPYHSSS